MSKWYSSKWFYIGALSGYLLSGFFEQPGCGWFQSLFSPVACAQISATNSAITVIFTVAIAIAAYELWGKK